MAVARRQTVVQLNDELLSLLDDESGRLGISRSELIRRAIVDYLEDEREAAIDAAIIEGYTRIPQEDDPWAHAALEGVLRGADLPASGDRMIQVCTALGVATGCRG